MLRPIQAFRQLSTQRRQFSVVLPSSSSLKLTQSASPLVTSVRFKRTKKPTDFGSSKDPPNESKSSKLFKPVKVKPNPDDIDLGQEIVGEIDRSELLRVLKAFFDSDNARSLSKEQGLDDYLFWQACLSFRKYCMDVRYLPPELYILFSDILKGAVHRDSIFPYFLTHARRVFPHLECLDELKLISDLTSPPNWYPEARNLNRKIIFHAGPTNSGKTYQALKRYMEAKSGVYCGPLKLLAVEVFNKANKNGTPCDLVTGEERKLADPDGEPSPHVSCTVEMTNVNKHYEVAVIDEIQMVKDIQRGWAWTRALLGLAADEIHVCGERAAVDLVREICLSTGEDLEVIEHERKTKLIQEEAAVESLENIQAGDCIVCFSKQDIYAVSRGLERLDKECAVIYGSLPPNTKLAMAERFNDPENPCKIMVATDAIGMGLNLNIRRIIFYSMNKVSLQEDGSKVMQVISVSQALQIAGRAGRFNTQWETGYVTCFHKEDMPLMKEQLAQTPEDILFAGLHPTFDQIEMYAYHLPKASLANLIDIFISLSVLDKSLYTLCHMQDFKFLADMIEHIKLPLKAKYTFCCAPINRKNPLVCTMFLKTVRQYSSGELVSFNWLVHQMGWPFTPPDTLLDLIHLEAVHDVFDLYLWLSYRFPDMFPDVELVRSIQGELDEVIRDGVANLVQLLRNSDSGTTSSAARAADEDAFEAKNLKKRSFREWSHGDGSKQGAKESSLGERLLQDGILTKTQLHQLSKEALGSKEKISGKLLQNGLLTKTQVKQILREAKK